MNTCLACTAKGRFKLIERANEGDFIECPNCKLQFVYPEPTNVPIFVDFSEAAKELFLALKRGADLNMMLTPSEQMALSWTGRTLLKGDTVFEVCCEVGRYLEGAKRLGLSPVGVDPVHGHVAHLQSEGFIVNGGILDAWRAEWPTPKAIVMLESLVRFPDPVTFLTQIRLKFPQAPLFVTVPSPDRSLKAPGFDRRSDYPPHNLTRWTPKALQAALEKAGYSCQVTKAYINANSLEVHHMLRLLVRLAFRIIGEADYSLVAVGTPFK